MKYKVIENFLDYNTYFSLRESVGWNDFCREQVEKSLKNSFHSIIIQYNSRNIGIGRVIGDGMYFTIVDVVNLEFQGKEKSYIRQGFKLLPNNQCGSALCKVIKK